MHPRVRAPWFWPEWVWLAGLSLILLVRFPGNFILHPPYLMDFDVYRDVAMRVVHGQAAHLYDPTTSQLMLFKYAPCWALIVAPLAWLPPQAGAVLWSALTVCWLIGACWFASRLCRDAGLMTPPWLSALAVAVLVRPVTAEFLNGQVDMLWALLVGIALAALDDRPLWSAAGLALAISLKLPATLVLLYVLARRRWRLAGATLALFLLLNATASLLLSPSHGFRLVRDWFAVLGSSGASRAFEIGNQSLLALAGRLLRHDGFGLNVLTLPDATVVFATLLVQVLLFAALFAPPAGRLPPRARLAFDGALLCVFMVLFSPTCWVATYSALIFPVSLALARFASALNETWRRPSWAAGLAGLVVFSALTHSTLWHRMGVHYFKGESYVFEVLMILPLFGLALAWCLWHQRRVAAARLS